MKFLQQLLNKSKPLLIEFFKKKFVKSALKKFFGAVISGPTSFIFTYIFTELFEEIAEPLLKTIFRNMGFTYTRYEGKKLANKIVKSRENNDQDAYDSSVDDSLQ